MTTALLEIGSYEPWNASPTHAYFQAYKRANIGKVPRRAKLYNIVATLTVNLPPITVLVFDTRLAVALSFITSFLCVLCAISSCFAVSLMIIYLTMPENQASIRNMSRVVRDPAQVSISSWRHAFTRTDLP